MADNVTIPATGSGTATPVIAADDVSSVFYQRVKLDGGGDGLAVPIIAGQQLAAGSIPVVLTAAQITTLTPPAALTGFATSAKQDTGNTSLSSIDGKITAVNTGAVVVASGSITANAGTNLNTSALATVAKQPALGTAGSASTDVITVQGIASGTAQPVSGTVAATQSGTWTVQPGNTANTTAWKVDGSAVTQPVSGTVTATVTGATVAGTGSAGSAASGVLTVQGISSMTKLLVTPDSVALPANQSCNVAQINGITPLMGAGNTGTGSARVTIVTDQAVIPISDNSGSVTVDAPVGTPVFVTSTPSTSGGWSVFMASSGDGSTALTNSAQAVKASAGTLGGWYIYNPNSSATYVIIYNTASGSVTVGTTNPAMVLCIPATSAANLELTNGIQFGTAIAVAATTTGGGNSAPSTALEANFWFK